MVGAAFSRQAVYSLSSYLYLEVNQLGGWTRIRSLQVTSSHRKDQILKSQNLPSAVPSTGLTPGWRPGAGSPEVGRLSQAKLSASARGSSVPCPAG